MAYGQAPPSVERIKGRASATDTANHELVQTPGPGFKLWVSCIVVNNSSGTQGTGVRLKSGTTTIWGPIPAPSAGASNVGGAIVPLPDPIDCNENEALNFSCDDNANVSVSVAGYKAVAT